MLLKLSWKELIVQYEIVERSLSSYKILELCSNTSTSTDDEFDNNIECHFDEKHEAMQPLEKECWEDSE